ncbi:hypothetical protein HMPREF9093_01663 [Fusobacterium sp. oral taxon 370 str. F0437]|uniref:biotin synthase BioB n=1 Tax=Fusobacterium sp. oral taxon 370 TaxID=712288 RepID=UPI000234AA0A|nr:biotin synthase BioB [Fusobacterium sp. oral taxon 370]EHI77978.1 hypothetical protein HMPREF9093_01663 [Fusobacterium sp. oral taxon 370 str. F0437]
MLKEKNSAGGGKFNFFNLLKEKDNELAESINIKEFISYLKDKIIDEKYEMTREEAIFLSKIPNNDMETLNLLFDAADQIREKFCGKAFDLCTIINAKSGKCSENCRYCAQSSHFKTETEVYGLISKELALCEAKKNETEGAHRFSLVTSGRGLRGNEKELDKLVEIYKYIGENTDKLELCASHGICTKEALQKLVDAGVLTYHHNLESSRRFYPNICTSHTYDDRINTIKNAKAVGLNVCSGGIFGLGETIEDRIDMALDLRELEIGSVPINILTPIPGTPFEKNVALEPLEILKTISIYRFIMPKTYLRYGGGRIKLGNYVKTGLRCGINSILTGNFLTTTGTTIEKDKKMIEELGYEL